MKRPAWAAGGTFAAAYSDAEQDVSLFRRAASRRSLDEAVVEAGRQAQRTLDLLGVARVIALTREQIAVIPLFDPDRLEGRFADLRLPFPTIYLSLDMAPSRSRWVTGETSMAGAILREDDDGTLDAIPIIPISRKGESRLGHLQPGARMHRSSGGEVTIYPTGSEATIKDQLGDDLTPENVLQVYATDRLQRILAVLGFLQSFNVELVEAPLSPRQRERELSKGREIALTVQIKQTKRYTSRSQQNGSANYSHRFETRGHYKHFFEFKPDGEPSKTYERCLNKDPSRLVTVDGKPCFRFWVPPFVKGPTDRPFVPKVRVVEA